MMLSNLSLSSPINVGDSPRGLLMLMFWSKQKKRESLDFSRTTRTLPTITQDSHKAQGHFLGLGGFVSFYASHIHLCLCVTDLWFVICDLWWPRWMIFFCVGSTQINFSPEKTTNNSIKKHQYRRRQKLGCGLAEGNSCGDSDSDGCCRRGWSGGCRYGGGRGNGQCKANSWGGGKNSTINYQLSTIKKMAAKTTAEVVGRPSAEDGNAVMVAVVAKAMSEGDGVMARWRRRVTRHQKQHHVPYHL